MLVIRLFEEKVEDLFTRGLVKGTAHPAIGQEAIAVGICSKLRKGDYVTSTHRGHGHFIAQGGDPNRIMAELFGKETGYSRGRGGSQVMADFSIGFLGANGITGGSIALASGAALALKNKAKRGIVACFFGDGATNQGSFHEALNMAAIWSLPVVYVCENNMYAMSMRATDSVSIESLATRADAYGFPGVSIDGNDLTAVQDAMHTACKRARAGDGPTLLECCTYRMSGHSRGDQRAYRSRAEETAWKKRDPIRATRKQLIADGELTAEQDREIRREVRAAVSTAITFAKRSPEPDPATLNDGVFA